MLIIDYFEIGADYKAEKKLKQNVSQAKQH